jgi:hypothetical protein
MNTFVTHPGLSLNLAHQTIDDRVAQAQQRSQARAARSDQRARARKAPRPSARPTEQYRLPWWAFRFVRPAG